jgi:hypothetical protein
LYDVTEGLQDVIIYRSADKENQKNRGFAFTPTHGSDL